MNKLPTIKVQGGQSYVMVKDRVMAFNAEYPSGSIATQLVSNNERGVLFKAVVTPDCSKPERIFTGHSEAFGDAKGVEGQKPVEVAETSSIGRALAAMGIGVIESYASADEVATAPKFGRTEAIIKKSFLASDKQIDFIKKLITEQGKPMPEEEWFTNLDKGTAKATIDKLLIPSEKSVKHFEVNDVVDYE